jgi:hypothetical protein
MKRKFLKEKKGQFIIIAILFIATMIVSIGAILYSTVTYYKYEPWDEYSTIIDGIEINSRHLVELSMSNYTNSDSSPSILIENLNYWKRDLAEIYPGYGLSLDYTVEDINGISYVGDDTYSSIISNVTFYLNITSLGLTGYQFNVSPSLIFSIVDTYDGTDTINVTVTSLGGTPILDLEEENFKIMNGAIGILGVTESYSDLYGIVHSIKCNSILTSPVELSMCDERGIKLTIPPDI